MSARVRPGKCVTIVDVSASGALVETSHRLIPGASVELHLETEHRRLTVRGHILRCYVARVRSMAVCYRGAIRFDCGLPWLPDFESDGNSVPDSENRRGQPPRADATQEVV